MSDFPKMHLTAYGEREEGCGECFFFALHVVVLPMVLILNDKARRGGRGGGICGSANLCCVILVSCYLCFFHIPNLLKCYKFL